MVPLILVALLVVYSSFLLLSTYLISLRTFGVYAGKGARDGAVCCFGFLLAF